MDLYLPTEIKRYLARVLPGRCARCCIPLQQPERGQLLAHGANLWVQQVKLLAQHDQCWYREE